MTNAITHTFLTAKTAAVLALAVASGAALAQVGSASFGDLGGRVGARVQPLTTAEEFVAIKRADVAPVAATVVELGEWAGAKNVAAEKSNTVQVGATRGSAASATVDATGALLNWQASSRGGQIAALNFVSNGAFGVRLGVQIDALPSNALIRVYEPGMRSEAFEISGQRVMQILQMNAKSGDASDEARTWWTPGVDGDAVTMEIELPASIHTNSVEISVPTLGHIFQDLSLPMSDGTEITTKINNAGACTLDSTCYDQFAAQRNAVARMYFVDKAGAYVCTGTLVNDKAGSGTPYFLTANHCISNQTVASTLQTSWFYRAPTCNSRTLSSASKTLKNGATLLYTSNQPDSTLLRLNDTPPAGAVFAGWDVNAVTSGAAVVGIHHPGGDLQKISFGSINGTSACTPGATSYSCRNSGNMEESYYRVQWSQGMTEGGSSGSALFVNGVLTGMLSNGSASCSKTGGTNNYSRFDKVFPAIQQWLSPAVAAAPVGITGDVRTAVYRFYNAQTGALFYTNNAAERDFVLASMPAFQYENAAFYAYTKSAEGLTPVFRFFNKQSGTHTYTASVAERDALTANTAAYSYEGIAWYASKAATADTTAVRSFFDAASGSHFYTPDAEEGNFLKASFNGLKDTGTAYNVWMSL